MNIPGLTRTAVLQFVHELKRENKMLATNHEGTSIAKSEGITITGTPEADSLQGGVGDDNLAGLGGNDLLDGGAGADNMDGGAGDDIFIVDNIGDRLIEAAAEGNDEARTSVSYTLDANVENLVLTGSAAINGSGNALNNLIIGNDAANVIIGNGGADTFVGGGGDDTYYVEADVVASGGGYVFSNVDQVVELAGGGTDSVITNTSYWLGNEVENLQLTGTLNLVAHGNALDNRIIGNAGNNLIQGGDGNDYLDGGAGADALAGGDGNDTYVIDSQLDDIRPESPSVEGGIDTVISSITYQLDHSLENLTLAGSTAIDGAGNSFANVLIGNDAANRLYGDGGNDTLVGDGGNDQLYGGFGDDALLGGEASDFLDGGAGADVMTGGTGDDVYVVDAKGDSVVELSGEGDDRIIATMTFALAAGASIETLVANQNLNAINLTGNELNQSLYGNDGANTLNGGGGNDYLVGQGGSDVLDGGAGSDHLVGGIGNDIYVIDSLGDGIAEAAGEGDDRVISSINYALASGVSVETLVAAQTDAAINLTGNSLSQSIYGNEAANQLNGADGNDYLVGYGGNDVLDGGTGTDTMAGGAGNDIYFVDSAGDSVIEASGEGDDRIIASSDYSLAHGVSVETMIAIQTAAALRLTGNDVSQSLYGNDSANVLNGGGGSDYLVGRGGADTFEFTTALGDGNVDYIGDFESGVDTIALSRVIFDALAPGELDLEALAIGAAATEADDRIVYDPTTGNLLYDADGSGSGAAVLIAVMNSHPALQASDFAVTG